MRLRNVVVAVGLITFAWTSLGIGVRAAHGAYTTADEPQYLLSAISLAEDFNLDISDELRANRWREFHEATLPAQTRPMNDQGRQISPHDPLLPLLLAVPVAIGGAVGAKIFLAALTGVLAGLLVWIAARRFDVPLLIAATVVLCFALAPPIAVYATQVYPELPAALVVAIAFALVTGKESRNSTLALIACISSLPWLATKYVPLAVVFAILALWRMADMRRLLLGGLATSAAIFAAAHFAIYGSWTPYNTADHFVSGGEFTVVGTHPDLLGRSRRLTGLLIDRDFGLIAWQPAYLIAIPASVALIARGTRHRAALIAPLVAGWLTATFVALTMHGWWFPGRQIVVILPLVILAVAWWCRSVIAPVVFAAIGAATFALLVLNDVTWAVDFTDTTNPLRYIAHALLPDETSSTPAQLWWHGVVSVLLVSLAIPVLRYRKARTERQTIDEESSQGHGRSFVRGADVAGSLQ